jgi:hypothetical protein
MEYMESKMQDQYEAAEHEYNDLCERLTPPDDWQNPEWGAIQKCHNWRRYISEDLQGLWPELSGRQRLIIAANAQDIADVEHWD